MMQDDFEPATTSGLTHQWVVAGIVGSAARFISVPFVDEMVSDRCRRYVVVKTLEARGFASAIDDLGPFYGWRWGCVSGCIALIVKAPLKLLLFPIRKIILVFTSVREIPLEITRTILLGRTLERRLQSGRPPTRLEAESMRKAFDVAFVGMDFRAAGAAIKDALNRAVGWQTAAISAGRSVLKMDPVAIKEIESSRDIAKGAKEVESILDRADTLALFKEFDERFDAELTKRL